MSLPALSSFAEQVGSTFEVLEGSPSPLVLKLVRVAEHAKTESNEAFSVFVLGPLDLFMCQGTRKLRHAQLGEMDIFFVPVAKTNAGFEYEAVFNTILSK